MKVLVKFLTSVLESKGQIDPDIGESDSDYEHAGYVCSFAFKDLRHDGYLSLVAGVGTPGRPSCRGLYVVDKSTTGFEVYQTVGAIDAGGDVSGSIEDLGKDGNLEFVLDDALGTFDNQCQVTFPAIYAWTGGDYANVSDRFKDFYRQQLDSLNKQISAIQPFQYKGASYEPAEKECLQAESAKIQRLLGISLEAGLDQAIRLANNRDAVERNFAVELFGQIGTPEARKHLETLAKDTDTSVAYMAKVYLSSTSQGPIHAPDAFERLH
jgi:hypothetical protein